MPEIPLDVEVIRGEDQRNIAEQRDHQKNEKEENDQKIPATRRTTTNRRHYFNPPQHPL